MVIFFINFKFGNSEIMIESDESPSPNYKSARLYYDGN